jgi:phosphopantothenoylcysteine decarboxylase/phosphopantothenate--cysteine ligase
MKKEGTLQGKEVVLGVTGSIAAYKAAEVASRLIQRGAGVTVVMTRAAAQFIGPLTFQSLTHRRVLIDPFDLETALDPVHVAVAERAGVVAVAPATANFLGKAAHGIADDMLTSLLLAVDCPVLVAPAMNDRMWKNAVVQENVRTLRKRGYRFVEPETGFLACGAYAKGRLADPARIVEEVEKALARGR